MCARIKIRMRKAYFMENMWTLCGMGERGLWIIFLEYWRYYDSKSDVVKGKKCVCIIEERKGEYGSK
jgi:hypothetical protein